jgi:alginate O-acetyltransferase complex protein AlgI
MQFNSFAFLVFFSIFYLAYRCCSHQNQNRLLLLASYLFYGAWDYRFIALIAVSTIINFTLGNRIARATALQLRRRLLVFSITCNLGILGFFKYFNFFADTLAIGFAALGGGSHSFPIDIILPIGISFYTFQIIGYTVDIYRKDVIPAPSFLDFALFVAFFPQVCAGPISRAKALLPQIVSKRNISGKMIASSTALILFGLFEKTVVADNLAPLVDSIYKSANPDGVSVLLATYAFAVQIFADFDGYSNMAKGLAGLMGISLITNFNAPYFSETPSEFWNRWHISLSSWLRDYLYIPLGGNRLGGLSTARNVLTTMILGGLWHGASWMFILWGGWHGLLLATYLPLKKYVQALPASIRKLIFFHLVCFGWMLFKTTSIDQFSLLAGRLLFHFHFQALLVNWVLLKQVLFYAAIPIVYQYLQYRRNLALPFSEWPTPCRAAVYIVLFYMIVIFGFSEAQSFIYFRF